MNSPTFDPEVWARVPFHFWSIVLFWFGSMVGSFLNVCIHRMPLGQSVVSPPSHCPHCRYSIPWFLNVPLVTWLYLRGKCKNCGAPISVRYFLVELLTGLAFLACWLSYGAYSIPVALIYCLILAGFIAATFIDLEHFIIPDEITLGGIVAGFICSFLVPALHGETSATAGMTQSFKGIAMGGGLIYGILRIGKLLFGRKKLEFPPDSIVAFTEMGIQFPDREMPFEEIFARESDTIFLQAKRVELIDRCYQNVSIRLSPKLLTIGEEEFDPETIKFMEVMTSEVVIPQEAMGFGDVKFMAAIGAFLGWQAVVFALMFSSILGAFVGVGLIAARKREWSARIPYGPYIAAAAVVWMFFQGEIVAYLTSR